MRVLRLAIIIQGALEMSEADVRQAVLVESFRQPGGNLPHLFRLGIFINQAAGLSQE